MRLKFLSFSNLTLLVALSLSSVAAWYSIIGLTAIFAGAVIPVIIMGGILEVGKITTTVWLRKYWHRASWLLKLYLVPAVIALALLTSMGIFGFLSKAHMEQGVTTGDVQAKLSLYDEKIKTQRENIELARKALTQMDNQVDQRLSRGDSENSAERAVQIRRQQAGERSKLQKDIGDAQKEIAKLNEERAPIAAENRKIEAEVGPIKYIAALIYGDNADNNTLEGAVRWVIILLVIVFDPLAIALVLAANASKEWDKEKDEEGDSPLGNEPPSTPTVTEPAYEPDDGPISQEVLEQLRERAKEELPTGELTTKSELFPDDPITCYLCGTPLENAPGIGPFCPNKNCDTMDNIEGVEWKFTAPEKSMLEQHPYLAKPFVNFDVKPLVSKKVVEEKPKKKRVKKEKIVIAPEIVEPVVVNKPKRSTPKKTLKIQPEIIQPIVEIPDVERPGDYLTKSDTEVQVMPKLPYEEIDGTYVTFKGRHMNKDVLKNEHPELFTIQADAEYRTPINTNFGIKFPDNAKKGDIFVRVDMLPNRVYKQDGNGRWIEVNKNNSDTYLHNQKYVEHLINMIDNGQYDPELLSDSEREQIERYIKRARKR